MVAYIKSVRFYNEALNNGHLTGKNGNAVLDILTEYTPIKDRKIYQEAVPQGNDPDGRVNVASLKTDLAFFKAQGLVTGNVTAESVVDSSFVDTAIKQIGAYRRGK